MEQRFIVCRNTHRSVGCNFEEPLGSIVLTRCNLIPLPRIVRLRTRNFSGHKILRSKIRQSSVIIEPETYQTVLRPIVRRCLLIGSGGNRHGEGNLDASAHSADTSGHGRRPLALQGREKFRLHRRQHGSRRRPSQLFGQRNATLGIRH